MMARRLLTATGLAVMLMAAPAAAQEPKDPTPEGLLDEAAEKVMRALELMMLAIPQYSMPEVLPNGDIIIRRKQPEADPPPKPTEPEPPEGGNGITKT